MFFVSAFGVQRLHDEILSIAESETTAVFIVYWLAAASCFCDNLSGCKSHPFLPERIR